ncbi:hypothetical protein SOM38_15685, partial [Pantoea agglomerans]|uniref:hypothetical protein n=2 Tax=Erwiniaceae TaxID=1903409 RepID=UPI002A69D6C2
AELLLQLTKKANDKSIVINLMLFLLSYSIPVILQAAGALAALFPPLPPSYNSNYLGYIQQKSYLMLRLLNPSLF